MPAGSSLLDEYHHHRLSLDASGQLSAVSPLSAPYPVDKTDIILYPRTAGNKVPLEAIVRLLGYYLSRAFQDVAVKGSIRTLDGSQAIDRSSRIVVGATSQKREGAALKTVTDLAEAASGVAFYMLACGCFARTYQVVRPISTGKGVIVASLDILKVQPELETGVTGKHWWELWLRLLDLGTQSIALLSSFQV